MTPGELAILVARQESGMSLAARRFAPALLLAFLMSPSTPARAAGGACVTVYVAPVPGSQLPHPLTPQDIDAITMVVRDGLKPQLPRGDVVSREDVAQVLAQAARHAAFGDLTPQNYQNYTDAQIDATIEQGQQALDHLNDDPTIQRFLRSSVVVGWSVSAIGSKAVLSLFATSFKGTVFRGTRVLPADSASLQTVSMAAQDLAREAGQKMAGKLYCLDLSEHNVTIHFNQPAQRRHPFASKLTDLTGAPVSGREVDFGQYGAGLGVLTPIMATTASGAAHTVFQAQAEPATIVLTARTTPPYQDALEDRATIAVVDQGLHVQSHYALDVAKFCSDKDGWIGAGVQLMQTIMQGLGMTGRGEQMVCSGESTEDDDLIIPSFQKTASGYTGTAHWITTLRLPSLTLKSSQFTEQGSFTPRTVSFDAQVTATPVNGDAHHLQIAVQEFATAVPTLGGAGSGTLTWAPGSVWGQLAAADRQLLALVPIPGAGAAAQKELQNPSPVDIPANQPMTAIFKLDFPLTVPSSAGESSPLSVSEDVDYPYAASNGLNRLRHVTIEGGFDVTAPSTDALNGR